jgi:deazaflavin-dependent oxidoreductase (nitroreductase family)
MSAVLYSADVKDALHLEGGQMDRAEEGAVTADRDRVWLPPRWFVRLVWHLHRGLYRVTRGRIGLWRPKGTRWGAMRLTVPGRRTGRPRSVIVGYFEDGPNLVTMAMNGWGKGEPAWWLNLQAHPEATVDLKGGSRVVRAHAAMGVERVRLWDQWRQIDTKLDSYAALRPTETAVVVLEPQAAPPGD